MDSPSTTITPEPPEHPEQSALQDLAERSAGGCPVVRLLRGSDAVILATGPGGVELLLLPDGETRTDHPQRAATLVTEPAEQATLLRQAMAVVSRDAAAREIEAAGLRREHARVLSEIRDYAIARHVDSEICRPGLNKFLAHFGMDAYRPRLRVDYTISGSYELEGSDRDHAERDARGYLRIDHNSLDNFVADSGQHTVTVDDVQELDD